MVVLYVILRFCQMTNFNYKLLNYLNDFNNLEKERYLSYMDQSHKLITKRKSRTI